MSFEKDTGCEVTIREAINFGERADNLPIDILLLHYTGMKSASAAINRLCAFESGVSCHYVVDEEGAVSQLVPEAMRAWHAGQSSWQGETDINSRSIGIEIANPGHQYGYPDFPAVQIKAVTGLSRDIIERCKIPAPNVLAHSDVAPGRKLDPGEKFPWRKLHQAGVGHWTGEVDAQGASLRRGDKGDKVEYLQVLLRSYGYGVDETGRFDRITEAVVAAFQMHFRQSDVTGVADAGTVATLEALIFSTGS